MKVKDLLEDIEQCMKRYGDDFIDWDVYTEQLNESDKQLKKSNKFGGHWDTVYDSEEWEYFKCHGFWTKFPDKKIFTININY